MPSQSCLSANCSRVSEDHNTMNSRRNDSGWIELICGGMFAGKTEELIRRLRRAQIARQKAQVFKPVIDNRYAKEKLASHLEREEALL